MERNVHDNVARRSLKQREGKKIKKEKKKEGKNLLQCFIMTQILTRKTAKKRNLKHFYSKIFIYNHKFKIPLMFLLNENVLIYEEI